MPYFSLCFSFHELNTGNYAITLNNSFSKLEMRLLPCLHRLNWSPLCIHTLVPLHVRCPCQSAGGPSMIMSQHSSFLCTHEVAQISGTEPRLKCHRDIRHFQPEVQTRCQVESSIVIILTSYLVNFFASLVM